MSTGSSKDMAIGLTSTEAACLLARMGPDAVADVAQNPTLRALSKIWAPVPWMLEAAILLQLAADDVRPSPRSSLWRIGPLTVATLVCGGQAVFHVARERRHPWSSMPGRWLLPSSAIDLLLVSTLAIGGALTAPLASLVLAIVAVAAIAFAFVLDGVRFLLFRRLQIA